MMETSIGTLSDVGSHTEGKWGLLYRVTYHVTPIYDENIFASSFSEKLASLTVAPKFKDVMCMRYIE
jgi:hypothetical protein